MTVGAEARIDEALRQADSENVGLNKLRRFSNNRSRDRLSDSIPGGYYRKPDGWIAYAVGWETAQGRRLMDSKGWSPLDSYPRLVVDQERRGQFHGMLRTGGAGEFIPAQIVQMGWDKKPPRILTCGQVIADFTHPRHVQKCYSTVEFPQMEGVTVNEIQCSMCRKAISSLDDVEVLLKKHLEVSHREHLVNKELVSGLKDALAPLLASGGMSDDKLARIISAAVGAASEPQAASVAVAEKPVAKRGKITNCLSCGGAITGKLKDHTCPAASSVGEGE